MPNVETAAKKKKTGLVSRARLFLQINLLLKFQCSKVKDFLNLSQIFSFNLTAAVLVGTAHALYV